MSSKNRPVHSQVNISAGEVKVDRGSTVGTDNSASKTVNSPATAMATAIPTPLGFLGFALKQLPILIWGVGVGGVIAVAAIAFGFGVPAPVAIFGSLAVFVGMFGLLTFASLVQPSTVQTKPPMVALVMLWSFAIILIASGVLTATSVFFDEPIPLRSLIVPAPSSSAAR